MRKDNKFRTFGNVVRSEESKASMGTGSGSYVESVVDKSTFSTDPLDEVRRMRNQPGGERRRKRGHGGGGEWAEMGKR